MHLHQKETTRLSGSSLSLKDVEVKAQGVQGSLSVRHRGKADFTPFCLNPRSWLIRLVGVKEVLMSKDEAGGQKKLKSIDPDPTSPSTGLPRAQESNQSGEYFYQPQKPGED
jgi:hypothetical protein